MIIMLLHDWITRGDIPIAQSEVPSGIYRREESIWSRTLFFAYQKRRNRLIYFDTHVCTTQVRFNNIEGFRAGHPGASSKGSARAKKRFFIFEIVILQLQKPAETSFALAGEIRCPDAEINLSDFIIRHN